MKKSSPVIAFLALLFFFVFAAPQDGTVFAAPHYVESTTTDVYANYSELAAAKREGIDYDILSPGYRFRCCGHRHPWRWHRARDGRIGG